MFNSQETCLKLVFRFVLMHSTLQGRMLFFYFFVTVKNNSKIYLIFCPIPENHNQIEVELIISFNLAKTIEIPVYAGIFSNSVYHIYSSAIDYYPGKKGLLEIDLM